MIQERTIRLMLSLPQDIAAALATEAALAALKLAAPPTATRSRSPRPQLRRRQ